jgi:hypothetical protein
MTPVTEYLLGHFILKPIHHAQGYNHGSHTDGSSDSSRPYDEPGKGRLLVIDNSTGNEQTYLQLLTLLFKEKQLLASARGRMCQQFSPKPLLCYYHEISWSHYQPVIVCHQYA